MTCEIGTDVDHAASILRSGGLVAFATETVYGLGANALNANAVARVFEVKNRPHFDPLIVHVAERSQLETLIVRMPAEYLKLADAFWPGPLTLVTDKQPIVPDLVTAGLPTVAVRVPSHPLAAQLLQAANIPIAAPSANLFGCISPTTAIHVAEQLGESVDYILDGGSCQVGLESTVLTVDDGEPMLLRPGGLPVEQIEAVIGPVTISPSNPSTEPIAQHSPGRLPKHYAPRTKLIVQTDKPLAANDSKHVGLLSFMTPTDTAPYSNVEILSPGGDLNEAAVNFFAALRRLDAANLDLIVAEPFPNQGLGRALNDRLQRAAAT